MPATRISGLFDRLKLERRAALIAYLTAGDPDLSRTPSLVEALEAGGADLIELGMPFSDPVADGPVIQRASERALRAGATLHGVLETAEAIRRRSEIPLLLFTYLNPVLRYGFEKLARDAAACGLDGVLLTDLTADEAESYVEIMHSSGLDTVFLAAPTSTPERLRLIASRTSGFLYLVSRTGVTGESESLSDAVAPLVRAAREATPLPLAVGFGISRPEQAREVARSADAVVVGSAFVRMIEQAEGSPGLEGRLRDFARQLRNAISSEDGA